jgi:hypothetical protein
MRDWSAQTAYRGSYDLVDAERRETVPRSKAPKEPVKVDAYVYREGSIITYLNVTSVDQVETFLLLRKHGATSEAKAFLKANVDYSKL